MRMYSAIFCIIFSLNLRAQQDDFYGKIPPAVYPDSQQQTTKDSANDLNSEMTKNKPSARVVTISGTPKYIRENPVSQVFISETGEGFTISEGLNYNKIYNAMIEAQKKRKSITFTVDQKAKAILDVKIPSVNTDQFFTGSASNATGPSNNSSGSVSNSGSTTTSGGANVPAGPSGNSGSLENK